jgi:hypothetical protein
LRGFGIARECEACPGRLDQPQLNAARQKQIYDADIERMFREFSKADLVLDGPFEPGAFLDRVVATIGQADEPGAPPRARRSMWGRVGEIV